VSSPPLVSKSHMLINKLYITYFYLLFISFLWIL